mmetsp:Transcript_23551/g.56308  ORF Transcript_23551/g.56308 Transcript_23551/m.56308 type:complete len:342 (-) Transcript_23551:752-1777(-)
MIYLLFHVEFGPSLLQLHLPLALLLARLELLLLAHLLLDNRHLLCLLPHLRHAKSLLALLLLLRFLRRLAHHLLPLRLLPLLAPPLGLLLLGLVLSPHLLEELLLALLRGGSSGIRLLPLLLIGFVPLHLLNRHRLLALLVFLLELLPPPFHCLLLLLQLALGLDTSGLCFHPSLLVPLVCQLLPHLLLLGLPLHFLQLLLVRSSIQAPLLFLCLLLLLELLKFALAKSLLPLLLSLFLPLLFLFLFLSLLLQRLLIVEHYFQSHLFILLYLSELFLLPLFQHSKPLCLFVDHFIFLVVVQCDSTSWLFSLSSKGGCESSLLVEFDKSSALLHESVQLLFP